MDNLESFEDDPNLLDFIKQVTSFTLQNHLDHNADYIWRDHEIILYFLRVRLRFLWNNCIRKRGYPENFMPGISNGKSDLNDLLTIIINCLAEVSEGIFIAGGFEVDIIYGCDHEMCVDVQIKYDKSDPNFQSEMAQHCIGRLNDLLLRLSLSFNWQFLWRVSRELA